MGGNNKGRGRGGKKNKKGGGKGVEGQKCTHPTRFDRTFLDIDGDSKHVENGEILISCPLCCGDEPCVAIGIECGHYACYKCQLRIRYIIGDDENGCPICKAKNKKLLLTSRPDHFLDSTVEQHRAESMNLVVAEIVSKQKDGTESPDPSTALNHVKHSNNMAKFYIEKFKVTFDDWDLAYDDTNQKELRDYVDDLFAYKCWVCNDPPRFISPDFRSLWDLKKHLETYHKKAFCDTCLYGRDAFLREQMLYQGCQEVDLHHQQGDGGLVPIKAHAHCDFCDKYFYTHEKLWAHMREQHAFCGKCLNAKNGQKKNDFYKDQVSLFNHIISVHYICQHDRCMQEGIFTQETVFNSGAELMKHRIAVHRNYNEPDPYPCPRLETWTTCQRNGHPQDRRDEDLMTLSQNEKPIYFHHVKNPERPPRDVILPSVTKKKEVERYPDMRGIGYKQFSRDKAEQGKKKKSHETTTEDTKNGDGTNGDNKNGEANCDLSDNNPKKSGEDDSEDEEDTKIYMKHRDFETAEQERIMRELPEEVLLLPPSARMDFEINKPSYLQAVDNVLNCLVGPVIDCKSRLITETMRDADGSKSKINIGTMKKHVAGLSPLQLDSLSEMRNCLLEMFDSRFDLDPISGLMPLFYRTLRSEDHENTPKYWLQWKHQAFRALEKVKGNEKDLIRIYVGLCLERNVVDYGGVDRAKLFPSLAQSAATKDGGFRPDTVQAPQPKGLWGSRMNADISNRQEAFPTLGQANVLSGASPRSGGQGQCLTMAEQLKMKQSRAAEQAKKDREKKEKVNNGFHGVEEDFPAMIHLAPKSMTAKKTATREQIFQNASTAKSSSSSSASAGASVASTSASSKLKIGQSLQPKATPKPVVPQGVNLGVPQTASTPTATASSSSSALTVKTTNVIKPPQSALKSVQERQEKEALKALYGPIKITDEKSQAKASQKKGLLNSGENFPALGGGSKKAENIMISKVTKAALPTGLSKNVAKKADIFEDEEAFCEGDATSFANVLLTSKPLDDFGENRDSWNDAPVKPLTAGVKKKAAQTVPDNWDDDAIFPTLGGGPAKTTNSVASSAAKKQEEEDARFARELQEAEDNPNGNAAAGNKKKKGREKKVLIGWG